jgi:hypothetical protein
LAKRCRGENVISGLRPTVTRASRHDGRFSAAPAIFAIALIVAFAATGARADLKLPPRPRGDAPMRIVRVASSDPACEPNCPEWISAEGRIEPYTADAFAKIVESLGGRRLPVLISSYGGSLEAAIRIGVLIRERRLAVAVAKTLIANCPELAPQCPDAKGQATTNGAVCASACPIVLAGGVERLVGPAPRVGVHQITATMKEVGGARLARVRKVYEPDSADSVLERYWAAMGVGEPVMTLLRKTPAASVRWLSLAETAGSRLATLELDGGAPILVSGVNGLNGVALPGDPRPPDVFAAKGAAAVLHADGAKGPGAEATLAYRRGGGLIEASLSAGASNLPSAGWTLTGNGGPLTFSTTSSAAPPSAKIPRARFCAVARDGKLTVASTGAESGASAVFDLSAMAGMSALIAEACP